MLYQKGRNFRNNPGQFLFFLKEEVYQALAIKFVFIQGQNNRLAHHPPRGNPRSATVLVCLQQSGPGPL